WRRSGWARQRRMGRKEEVEMILTEFLDYSDITHVGLNLRPEAYFVKCVPIALCMLAVGIFLCYFWREVHLHLRSPENSIRGARVAPLLKLETHAKCSMKCRNGLGV
ncbi:unnamed protein product, partial [Prunus brigantina]